MTGKRSLGRRRHEGRRGRQQRIVLRERVRAPAHQLSAATHTISLVGVDPHGGADSTTVQVTVYEPNAAPIATITEPSQDTTAIEGDTLTFVGTGQDAVDGPLTGSDLSWESDLDGPLGTGGTVSVSTLSVGAHTVSLIATDSDGLADTAGLNPRY